MIPFFQLDLTSRGLGVWGTIFLPISNVLENKDELYCDHHYYQCEPYYFLIASLNVPENFSHEIDTLFHCIYFLDKY